MDDLAILRLTHIDLLARNDSGVGIVRISEALQTAALADCVPELVAAYGAFKESGAAEAAILDLLGRAGWQGSRPATEFLDSLITDDLSASRLTRVVRALGMCGRAELLPRFHALGQRIAEPVAHTAEEWAGRPAALLAEANESYEFDTLTLLMELAAACARCGDHSLAYLPVFFAGRAPSPTDEAELTLVRAAAASALQHAVGDGMFEALAEAALASDLEVSSAALNAGFFLGLRQSIELGLRVAATARNPSLQGLARTRFVDLTGAPFSDSHDDLRQWWAQHGEHFKTDVCYRSGKPWSPISVIHDLLREPERQADLGNELVVALGIDFSGELARGRTLAEIETQAMHIVGDDVGCLFKTGRLVALAPDF